MVPPVLYKTRFLSQPLRGPGWASTSREGGGSACPSQGLQRAARALPGPGTGVGPTGEPADLGRNDPRLPEWQSQTERLRRTTPLRPFSVTRATSGTPSRSRGEVMGLDLTRRSARLPA